MQLNVLIIFLVLFVVFIPIAVILIKKAGVESKLSREGVLVKGRIIDHRQVSNGGRGGYNYYLTYSYNYKGSTYSREELVNDEIYRLGDGATFPVRCLPERPEIATLDF